MTDTKDLEFIIDYANSEPGGVKCYLGFNGVSYLLEAWDNDPPFHDFLTFLQAIWMQRLPARFYWDNEGEWTIFEALPLADDSPDFHLRVYPPRTTPWIDDDLHREGVINIFLSALRDFTLHSNDMFFTEHGNGFGMVDWGFSLHDLVILEEYLKRKIPLRTDINSAGEIHFTLTHKTSSRENTQNIVVQIWDINYTRWILGDTDPFWTGWFAFLEQVLCGQPAELTFPDGYSQRLNLEMVIKGVVRPQDINQDDQWCTTLRGELLDHPRHFRFQIIETSMFHRNFLLFDEVLERAQFAGSFIQDFEKMLSSGYQPMPDFYGASFDLRTLPVDRIKALLAEWDSTLCPVA